MQSSKETKSTKPVIFWQGVLGDEELRQRYGKVLDKILHGEPGAKLHKLEGFDNVLSAYEDDTDRLILTIETIDGEPYLMAVKGLPDHKYKKLKKKDLKDLIARKRVGLPEQVRKMKEDALADSDDDSDDDSGDDSEIELVWKEVTDEEVEAKFAPIRISPEEKLELQPADYIEDRLILFNLPQQKSIKTKYPAIIIGAPGSGKTCVALEIATLGDEDATIVVQSPLLAAKIRKQLRKILKSKPHIKCNIRVMLYEDLLREIDTEVAGKETVGKEHCLNWLADQVDKKKGQAKVNDDQKRMLEALQDEKEREKIYQEFRSICAYSENSYLNQVGDKDSVFPKEDRPWLYKLYKAYVDSLADQKKINLSFYINKLQKILGRVIIDESQDFSLAQLGQLNQWAKEVCYLMDSNQNVTDYLSKLPFLIRMLKTDPIVLPGTFRCPYEIAEIANEWLKITFEMTGGKPDKLTYSTIALDKLKTGGERRWVNDTDKAYQELVEDHKLKYGKRQVAIVVNDEATRLKAIKLFKTKRVFTPAQIKGQEFDSVFCYGFLHKEQFETDSNKLAKTDNVEVKAKVHRAKADKREVDVAPTYFEWFTALTRARKSLIVLEDDKRHETKAMAARMKRIFDAPPPAKRKSQSSDEPIPVRLQKTAEQERIETIEDSKLYLQNGNTEQAIGILEDEAGMTRSEAEIFATDYMKKLLETKDKQKPVSQPSSSTLKSPQIKTSTEGKASPGALKKPPVKVPSQQPLSARQKASPSVKTKVTKNFWNELFEAPDGLERLFTPNGAGSCLFLELLNDLERNQMFIVFAGENQQLLRKIHFSYLFKPYKYLGYTGPLITHMLGFQGILSQKIVIRFLLENAKADELEKLVALLCMQQTIKHVNGTTIKCTGLFEIIRQLDILDSLLNHHGAALAVLLTGHLLSQVRVHGEEGKCVSVSALEMLSITTEGCAFITKLSKKNPNLFAQIRPSAMFRFHIKPQTLNEETTLFRNLYGNTDSYNLLTSWLDNDGPIDYLINLYKTASSADLKHFTKEVFSILTISLISDGGKALNRLLKRDPEFLTRLAKNGMFDSTDGQSLFSYLIIHPSSHPFLKKMFDADPSLYNLLDQNFIDLLRRADGKYQMNPPMFLTATEPGLEILENIITARSDFKIALANLPNLCSPFVGIKAKDRLPISLYQKLNSRPPIGPRIIKMLLEANPELTLEKIDQTLAKNELDFLGNEECGIIDAAKSSLSPEILLALLKRSNAKRLLFGFARTERPVSFFQYLCENNDRLVVLRDALIQFDLPLTNIFPEDFLALAGKLPTGQIFSMLLQLSSYPAGQDIVKFFCKNPAYASIIGGRLFRVPGADGKYPLIDDVLKNKNLHWLLDEGVEKDDEFVKDLSEGYFAHKLSDGAAFSMLCHYHPDLVTKIVARLKVVNPKLSAGQLIFGNNTLIPSHFYWLSKHLDTHKVLLSIFESEDVISCIPSAIFGLPVEKGEPPALHSLIQSMEGRKVLRLYINDAERAKKIVQPELFCKSFGDKDAITILSKHDVDLAFRILEINPALISSLNIGAILRLKPFIRDSDKIGMALIQRETSLAAQVMAASTLSTFSSQSAGSTTPTAQVKRSFDQSFGQ